MFAEEAGLIERNIDPPREIWKRAAQMRQYEHYVWKSFVEPAMNELMRRERRVERKREHRRRFVVAITRRV